MKVKNKLTGEINILKVDEDYFKIYKDDGEFVCPVTLKELNDGWEDYEEPKVYWFIKSDGNIGAMTEDSPYYKHLLLGKELGNYFETREEAEKAVERLRAWKRLKDKGVRIGKRSHGYYGGEMFWECPNGTGVSDKQIWLDLDLLFGGEE